MPSKEKGNIESVVSKPKNIKGPQSVRVDGSVSPGVIPTLSTTSCRDWAQSMVDGSILVQCLRIFLHLFPVRYRPR